MNNKFIKSDISKKIIYLGVSKHTKGGMTSVIKSYDKYIEDMRFIPTWRLSSKFIKILYAISAVIRLTLLLAIDKRIEIIHIHGAAYASFYRCTYFIRIAKMFHKKIIMHEHAAEFKDFFIESNNKEKIVSTLNDCDKLIVLSKSWESYYISIGVDKNRICIINNIISPPNNLKKIINRDEKLHLLFLGEISKRKGCFDLINAINKDKEYLRYKISLKIGGNIVDGDIEKVIKDFDISSFVHYEGWINGNKKERCLEWADIFILPSYNEGLPIAILENMSYSHPIISTPVGGIPEIVHNHYNGILIEQGNVSNILNAIHFFIDNPMFIKKYGANSFTLVKPYLPENVFSELTVMYKKLLSHKNYEWRDM
jgi:glycosyltransferase involved in cell wall biosynthesis